MTTWQQEDNADVALKVGLFLVSPFIGAVYALRNIKTRSSFVIFFLFALCFGMAFTVPPVKDHNNMLDGAHYRETFEYHYEHLKDLDYVTILKLAPVLREDDIFALSLRHLATQFSSNYHIFFILVAMVFALYALKSLQFLVLEKEFQVTIGGIILLYLFMINDIFNINGVRFWTAAWIGVYCIFQIFRNGNKRYFLLAFVTPFVHAAFVVYLIVIIGAYFVKKSHRPWVILFFLSFLVSNLSVDLARSIIDRLPGTIGRLAAAYTDEDYIQKRASSGSGFFWVTQTFAFMVKVYMNVLVFLFIKNINQVSSNPKSKKLFSFLLIWMTFVNFTMPIPSFGGRFMAMAYPIIAYIWLVNFYNVKYTKVLYAMPFIFLFSFYRTVLYYNKVLDPSFFVSSPLYLVYKYLIAA